MDGFCCAIGHNVQNDFSLLLNRDFLAVWSRFLPARKRSLNNRAQLSETVRLGFNRGNAAVRRAATNLNVCLR